jgi:hypothetical protein
VQEVDLLFTDPRNHVGHLTKSSLKIGEVEVLPIGDQLLEPSLGRSELPPLLWKMSRAASDEPVPQLLHRAVGDYGRHWLDFDATRAHAYQHVSSRKIKET